jgi:cystathionine beta-synthase
MESEKGLEGTCTFDAKNPDWSKCPHIREVRDYSKGIKNDITDCVGNTPMVRINNITKKDGIKCEILAKCEFLNPGGSVKDRIGRRMVVDALKDGRIKEGDVLIEPTSGNTGIGLSVAAAAKGMKMIITMPEKMSQEKRDVLTALGAEIIRTPNHYSWDHKYCHIGIAFQLEADLENAHVLDQYKNPGNPLAHYEETGKEIWEQCDGRLDYVFIGAGTAGTITGISRYLKEKDSNIKIIGIDPFGSILAEPAELNTPGPEGGYHVEGIGYDFIPRVCDRTLVDEWMKSGDDESFECARRLIKEEGFLCGGSSGTALAATLQYVKENNVGEGKRCVFLCPDNIRNYISKFVNNDWMYEHGQISEEECMERNIPKLIPYTQWGQDYKISDLPLQEALFLDSKQNCKEAIALMKAKNYDQFPVKDAESGKTLGMVRLNDLTEKLAKRKVNLTGKVTDVMTKDYRNISGHMPLSELSRIFEKQHFVFVDNKFIASNFDLLTFMSEKMEIEEQAAKE